ncbi:hypothetical protein GGX14DRAFT_564360 [Mycena pura]|uniref:Uncharacterized protein n=1 Tax=Mycena pura TaxID=153505 RepID=A0AAD6VIM6_9AGAR|nr:hypothetical protein GGX14DRAFT_564360 [Mycena pura]
MPSLPAVDTAAFVWTTWRSQASHRPPSTRPLAARANITQDPPHRLQRTQPRAARRSLHAARRCQPAARSSSVVASCPLPSSLPPTSHHLLLMPVLAAQPHTEEHLNSGRWRPVRWAVQVVAATLNCQTLLCKYRGSAVQAV